MRARIVLSLAIVASAATMYSVGFTQAPDQPARDGAQQQDQPRQDAQRPPDGPPGGGFRPPALPLITALDANGDGEISEEEVSKAAEAIAKLDKNSDGEVNAEELAPEFGFGGGRGGRGGRGGPGGPGGFGRQTEKTLGRFDADKNGLLNAEERSKARADLKEKRAAGGGRGRGGPFGGRGGGGGEGQARKPGQKLSPADVAQYASADLYDPHILRTLFFEFENKDWEEELEDFHGTDVEVPAKLIVDGKTYDNVGLRFRGTSSYGGVPRGQKRSLNVTLDLVDADQTLLGYRTLNLLNSHTDPSFLRAVLYNHFARQYIPAPQANLVRVVINGESWGVYVNEEQYNKDFVRKWFGEDTGARWKVPPNFSGAAALVYHSDRADDYRNMYEIKAKNEEQAWADLIALCKQLKDLPDERIEELDKVLNVDRALWFLAIDNVFIDEDGYFSRGSDYSIYQDARFKRFHLMPRDSNETFRYPGGGPGGRGGPGGGFFVGGGGGGGAAGPGGGRGGPAGAGGRPADDPPPGERARRDADAGDAPRRDGPGGDESRGGERRGDGGRGADAPREREPAGPTRDPLEQIHADNRPLLKRLLSNPSLKARYLAHVRTIIDESLDWKVFEPVFEDYRALVAEDILADTRNLSNFTEFFDADIAGPAGGGPFGGPPGIKRFVEERRKFLLAHPELTKPRPAIAAVSRPTEARADAAVEVTASVSSDVPPSEVILYYAVGRGAPFKSTAMQKSEKSGAGSNGLAYAASIPGTPAGAEVLYYVEARGESGLGTTTFSPRRAEFGALRYTVAAADAAAGTETKSKATDSTASAPRAIVLNEVMAANTKTIKDPQGKYADWIELANVGTEDVELSGMYLSDKKENPRKWKFPADVKLRAGEHLIVWADEGGKDAEGLHANFKLSKNGENIWLIDTDAHNNKVLDKVEFASQRQDVAFGRFPDGKGEWRPMPPTPGKANVEK